MGLSLILNSKVAIKSLADKNLKKIAYAEEISELIFLSTSEWKGKRASKLDDEIRSIQSENGSKSNLFERKEKHISKDIQ